MRKRRQLAVVRSLWERRDEVARRRDIAPGRVLPDSAIVAAALASPRTEEDLVALPVWGGRSMRRQTSTWLPAIAAALALPDEALPEPKTAHEGPPPARSWGDREPAAAARLAAARAAVGAVADEHRLPVENLLSPDTVRRLAWDPPPDADAEVVAGLPAGARRPRVAGRADCRGAGHRAGPRGRGPVLTARSRRPTAIRQGSCCVTRPRSA